MEVLYGDGIGFNRNRGDHLSGPSTVTIVLENNGYNNLYDYKIVTFLLPRENYSGSMEETYWKSLTVSLTVRLFTVRRLIDL